MQVNKHYRKFKKRIKKLIRTYHKLSGGVTDYVDLTNLSANLELVVLCLRYARDMAIIASADVQTDSRVQALQNIISEYEQYFAYAIQTPQTEEAKKACELHFTNFWRGILSSMGAQFNESEIQ